MMNLLELSKATGLPPEDLRGILHDRYHRVVLHELAPVNTEAETELLAEYAIRSPPHPAKSSTPVSPAPALTVSASGPRPFSFCAAFQITMCSSTPVACFTPVSFPFTRSIVKRSPAPSAFLMW